MTYSVNSIGMKYERMLFGMKISDANCLAKAIQATETLASLVLQVRGWGGEALTKFVRHKACVVDVAVFTLWTRHRQESLSMFSLCCSFTLVGLTGRRSANVVVFWSRQGNLIDDDLMRMLMTGLIRNSTITYLDVSHNKITNHGESHNVSRTVVPPYNCKPLCPTTFPLNVRPAGVEPNGSHRKLWRCA